jgi:hypothetical protein
MHCFGEISALGTGLGKCKRIRGSGANPTICAYMDEDRDIMIEKAATAIKVLGITSIPFSVGPKAPS